MIRDQLNSPAKMISSKVKRVTVKALDGTFGPDRDKPLVVTFLPANGEQKHDLLEIKPLRARGFRAERIAVLDVYRYALRCRVNRELLEKARARKSKIAERRANARLARAEKKLRMQILKDPVL